MLKKIALVRPEPGTVCLVVRPSGSFVAAYRPILEGAREAFGTIPAWDFRGNVIPAPVLQSDQWVEEHIILGILDRMSWFIKERHDAKDQTQPHRPSNGSSRVRCGELPQHWSIAEED